MGDTASNNENKRTLYRTEEKAGANGVIPSNLCMITAPNYQNAMSLYPKGKAFLMALDPEKRGEWVVDKEKGSISIGGFPASEATIRDLKSEEVPVGLDLSFFQLCAAIIIATLYDTMPYRERKDGAVEVYYPKLAKALYGNSSVSEGNVEGFISRFKPFQCLMGHCRDGIYAVLLFHEYDRSRNVIKFSSPYLNHMIKEVMMVSIKKDKKGNAIKSQSGIPKTKPFKSHLISTNIVKERNKLAIVNVGIIVALIEQAGSKPYTDAAGKKSQKGNPHIKASEIVERNPQFKARLEDMSNKANQNRLLKTTFKKTWELLREYTHLLEKYIDIQLPDPEDPTNLPSRTGLGMVFTFSHRGKSESR